MKNVTLADSYINSVFDVTGCVGGIAGENYEGLIENCTVSGAVVSGTNTSTNTRGSATVGGNVTYEGTVYAEKGSTLAVESGTVKKLIVYPNSTVTLSGGNYGEITRTGTYIADVYDYSKTPTFGAMLATGYAFNTIDGGTWYDAYNSSDATSIQSVEVKPVPITSLSITGGGSYTYGQPFSLSAVLGLTNTTGKVEYQWAEVKNGTPKDITDENLSSCPLRPDAGDHTCRLTVTKDNYSRSAEASVNVAKADISLDDITVDGQNATYDGRDQALLSFVGYSGSGTIYYSLDTGTTRNWSTDIPKRKDAGTYEITFTGKGNYTGTMKATWRIQKAAAPTGVTATEIQQLYTASGGTADLSEVISGMPAAAGTIGYALDTDNLPSGCTGSIGEDGKTFLFTVPGPDTVGDGYTFPVVVSFTNYENVTVNVTVKLVEKLQKTLTVTMAGWTYGGKANAPICTPAVVEGMTVTIEFKVRGENDDTYSTSCSPNAGDYTVKVSYVTATEIWTGTADTPSPKPRPAAQPLPPSRIRTEIRKPR